MDTLGVLPTPCVFTYHGMMFALLITVQHCCALLMIHYNPADPPLEMAIRLLVKYTVPMQLGTHLLENSLSVVLVFHALPLL